MSSLQGSSDTASTLGGHDPPGGVGLVEALAGLQTARGDGEAGALDCYEGISTPRRQSDSRTGCKRWPERLWLRSSFGEIVAGRCKATNLCPYCQRLYVGETVEMLLLDAAEWAPTVWVVLTSREHLLRRDTYRHLEFLLRAGRRRWPGLQWFVQVEFQRRGALHLNLLCKGVPAEDSVSLLSVLSERWCARVDALPVGQHVEVVREGSVVFRYLAKMLGHGLKQEQAPPLGWRGHRTSQTRGYLVRPASVMRLEARASRTLRREVWKATRQLSFDELVRALLALPEAERTIDAAASRSKAVERRVVDATALRAAASWALWRQPATPGAPAGGRPAPAGAEAPPASTAAGRPQPAAPGPRSAVGSPHASGAARVLWELYA